MLALRVRIMRTPCSLAWALDSHERKQPTGIPTMLWIQREFERIGVDVEQLPALAIAGPYTGDDFMRWLCTLPSGLGHAGFLARLKAPPEAGGLRVLTPEEWAATGREAEWQQLQDAKATMRAFWRELSRVAPASTWGDSTAFQLAYSEAATVEALQALPSGIGLRAMLEALDARLGPRPALAPWQGIAVGRPDFDDRAPAV